MLIISVSCFYADVCYYAHDMLFIFATLLLLRLLRAGTMSRYGAADAADYFHITSRSTIHRSRLIRHYAITPLCRHITLFRLRLLLPDADYRLMLLMLFRHAITLFH